MPRMARVVLPHTPHHVVQRGHNRQTVFVIAEDYERYLEDLRELSGMLDIRVHAYCLMTNHVHLLVDPGEEVASMGCLMKALAARATRRRNRLERRSGTLWEGRYKSSPVQTDTYLLACTRYIELNPVRAGMVSNAGDHPWSSYQQRMGHETCWINTDPGYLSLAGSEMERRARYARFVAQGVPKNELSLMREAVQRGQLTGNHQFVDEVEKIIGRRIEQRRPGRPSSR
ncbi:MULTISPECIES: transposase [unclassified Ectothiorhodospira]|uniref:transposase n=1 Tax=unclassified Ectothiorhodospira TaxID=2684909 RepID=UPI001EE7F9E9|nr:MULTISPECIES: transposase [unclassified Ectothiorhodospira]MCG5515025.1 transposase [Ectothiorhodospira sp. 9100]MCG5517652.1 transposase [Ectothiorhodospira sp. 9905]